MNKNTPGNKNKPGQSLDETDRKILRLLRENAHMTTQEVADKVGLSQTPCWSRIKRLEDTGIIAGYVALLDPERSAGRYRSSSRSISISMMTKRSRRFPATWRNCPK